MRHGLHFNVVSPVVPLDWDCSKPQTGCRRSISMTDHDDQDWDEDDAERDLEAEFRALGFRSRDSSSDPDEHEDETDAGEPPELTTGERGVEISMEIDEQGNEVWYANDSEVPGSTSMGHSVEEAIEGVEDRRKAYRELRRRSREERDRKKREE